MRPRANPICRAGAAAFVLAVVVVLAPSNASRAEPAAKPAPRLSQAGLFEDAGLTRVRRGNLPFVPQYPLWTDGASKKRWIRLPRGKAIDASRPEAWQFPVGTRLWKEFSFDGRRVETRTLERVSDGSWRFATYVWNRDGSEAHLAPPEGFPAGIEVRPGVRHVIPGENDCRACHEGRETPVLGFDALQLSPDRDPRAAHAETPSADAVDLRTLVKRGLLRGLPQNFLSHPPRIPAANATERAALGYLHANCGGCHNGEGPLAAVGLSLAQDPGDDKPSALDSLLRESQFRIPALDGASFRILPGHPERSAVFFRMRSRDPTTQMPPLGTQVVDQRGLALIEEWIRQTNKNEEKTP